MSWENYTGTATKGSGGDWPAIPDDIYSARIMDVSEPEIVPDPFKPGMERSQFYIVWELMPTEEQTAGGCGQKTDGSVTDEITIRQYLNIPDGIKKGYINEKSLIYGVMVALGYDLEQEVEFNPPNWIDARARVVVENKEREDGSSRPRVEKVMAARKAALPGRSTLAPARK